MAWKSRQKALERLAEGMMKVGAIQFGTFTLTDGEDSSYLVNLRGLPSYPGVFSAVVESMLRVAKSKVSRVDAICSVPVSGLLFAAPLALSLGKPLVYTRSTGRGSGRTVEGEVRPGWEVMLVDDLASSGKTLLATAGAAREEGCEVKHAVVFLDRMEGARERLHKDGIALHAVTDIIELADTLVALELIGKDDFSKITKTVGATRRP
ncbi:MAG TPA: phosphoribosyltransferase family protein [Nitrososphaerales archaeon]|nr:phosphoribosyltransferase family protein [Nitrososphaerales archaeon]